jgi:hypothetical protein
MRNNGIYALRSLLVAAIGMGISLCLVGADVPLVKVDQANRTVRVAAEVNLRVPKAGVLWPIEVVLCQKGGKMHEAAFFTEAVPSEIHKALVSIGLKPGSPTDDDENGKPIPAKGERVDIFMEWRDVEGKEHREPAEKMLAYGSGNSDPRKGGSKSDLKSCPPQEWLFTGSRKGLDPDSGKEIYGADQDKNIIVINHQNRAAMFEKTKADEEGFIYDTGAALPPAGTQVIILFQPAQ